MYGTSLQFLNSSNKGAFSSGLRMDYYSEVQTGRHCKVQGGNSTARLEAMRSYEIPNKNSPIFQNQARGGAHLKWLQCFSGELVIQCKRSSNWRNGGRWDVLYEWDRWIEKNSPVNKEKWGRVTFKTYYVPDQACRHTDLWCRLGYTKCL